MGGTGETHTSAGNHVRTVDDTWYRVTHTAYTDALAATTAPACGSAR
ncbi:hypothetical protein [Streptomyces bauhiniae]|nr:hypothetical protein [Streptomyces bauhiniae]